MTHNLGANQDEDTLQKHRVARDVGAIQNEGQLQESHVARVVGGAIRDESQPQEYGVKHGVAHGETALHKAARDDQPMDARHTLEVPAHVFILIHTLPNWEKVPTQWRSQSNFDLPSWGKYTPPRGQK